MMCPKWRWELFRSWCSWSLYKAPFGSALLSKTSQRTPTNHLSRPKRIFYPLSGVDNMTSTSHDAVIPEGSRVLVTGANGFIASNIIDHLLNNGYNVRGTIRNQKPWLDALFNDRYGQGFESFVLPCFQDTEALDRALDGVSGVIHAVRPLRATSIVSIPYEYSRPQICRLLPTRTP